MMDIIKDQTILKKNGTQYTKVVFEDAFKDVQRVVCYFGAKWCSDCVKFTPLLRDVYQHAKSNNESLEVLYVSSDKSEEEMKEFAAESHDDWYFCYVCEDDDSTEEFKKIWNFRGYHGIWGIPSIAVIKKPDDIYSSLDGVSDVLNKGLDAVTQWKENEVDMDTYVFDEIQPKRPSENAIIPNCCRISRFKPWVKTQPTDVFKGIKMRRKVGKEFVEESADLTLRNAEIVGLYFSANWCGPCHLFTPILRECYNELKNDNKSFEIIYIPLGESEDDTIKYMQDLHGDWLVVSCEDGVEKVLARKFHVEGIPSLRILNKLGDLITMEGDQELQAQGAACYPLWLEGKPGATDEEIQKYWNDLALAEGDEGDEQNNEINGNENKMENA